MLINYLSKHKQDAHLLFIVPSWYPVCTQVTWWLELLTAYFGATNVVCLKLLIFLWEKKYHIMNTGHTYLRLTSLMIIDVFIVSFGCLLVVYVSKRCSLCAKSKTCIQRVYNVELDTCNLSVISTLWQRLPTTYSTLSFYPWNTRLIHV